MSKSEKQLGLVKDIVLPIDAHTRYDIYFTDKRIAIVCMGKANRFESEASGQVSIMPSAFGVPQVTSSFIDKTEDKQTIDEETKNLSLDELLKLSKKSCFYTYDEIDVVRLICGHSAKFIILSKECESKLSPDPEQFKKLTEILRTIEPLRNKLWIAGKWTTLLKLEFLTSPGKFRGSGNNPDEVYCQCCGKKINKES